MIEILKQKRGLGFVNEDGSVSFGYLPNSDSDSDEDEV